MSQLFVGRLPREVQSEDLEKIFEKFGKLSRCDVKRGVNSSYGFVEFADASHAPDAIAECNGMTVEGETIVVEMATGAARKRNDSHWAKDCSGSGRRNGRGRSPRRSRSRDRGYRGRGSRRDDHRGRRSSRSRSPYRRNRSPRKREPGRGYRRDWSRPPNGRDESRARRSPSPRRHQNEGAQWERQRSVDSAVDKYD
ncbi:hypothetical protein IWW42_001050 [Coemansia sp. RSA 1085]|nr:hypothetical protein IWW42_001050 [Coemansia sp. RSA 1085]